MSKVRSKRLEGSITAVLTDVSNAYLYAASNLTTSLQQYTTLPVTACRSQEEDSSAPLPPPPLVFLPTTYPSSSDACA